MSVNTIVITAGVRSRVSTLVLHTGPPGKSAYQSYVQTTDDSPVLSEAEWSEPGSGGTIITSETPPSDLTAGWLDPSDGTTSYHNGVFWVTGSEVAVSGEGGSTTDPESELTDGTYFLDLADNFFASDTGEIFTDPLS